MALLVVSIVGLGCVLAGIVTELTGAIGTGAEMQMFGAVIGACAVGAGLGGRGSR